jgi:hypothetical protein
LSTTPPAADIGLVDDPLGKERRLLADCDRLVDEGVATWEDV